MPTLQIESPRGTINLNDVLIKDKGIQVMAGVTGLGLPSVVPQWLEGAGDGATYRGRRVLPRDIDLPVYVDGGDREGLKDYMSQLALVLSDVSTLRFIEDDNTSWSTDIVRTGGGGYVYGVDTTGEHNLLTVLTVRAGDPFWTHSVASNQRIDNSSGGRGVLGSGVSLVNMRVSKSRAIGTMDFENIGDADAYPIWTVHGPGQNFLAIGPDDKTFKWNGTLGANDVLTIDTKQGLVFDQAGANRYAELDPAPKFWTIPPGTSQAVASLDNASSASFIRCTWRPRKWLVV